MFQNNNRLQLRQFFVKAWQNYQQKVPLSAIEQQIVNVLLAHPEYHAFLQENMLEQDFFPEQGQANPFLHMSLHLGIQEQAATNRPFGIKEVYEKLSQKVSAHEAEHVMMDCLAEAIWQAQRNNTLPDENKYLQCLQELL